jgi:hypothetical protein
MVERRNTYRMLVGKPKGKSLLGRCRHGWRYLREIGLGGLDWIVLAQDTDQWRALVNTFRFHAIL